METEKGTDFYKTYQSINVSKFQKKEWSGFENIKPEIPLTAFSLQDFHVYDNSEYAFNYNSIKTN
jgi:hypothetical protein